MISTRNRITLHVQRPDGTWASRDAHGHGTADIKALVRLHGHERVRLSASPDTILSHWVFFRDLESRYRRVLRDERGEVHIEISYGLDPRKLKLRPAPEPRATAETLEFQVYEIVPIEPDVWPNHSDEQPAAAASPDAPALLMTRS